MEEYVVEVSGLSFRYDRQNVLEQIDLNIPKGAFLGIIGPNGSGKSTLLKLMLGLLKPQEGEIRLFGTPLSRFKDWSRIGFVSQKANAFNTGYPATVLEVVESGLVKKPACSVSLAPAPEKKQWKRSAQSGWRRTPIKILAS